MKCATIIIAVTLAASQLVSGEDDLKSAALAMLGSQAKNYGKVKVEYALQVIVPTEKKQSTVEFWYDPALGTFRHSERLQDMVVIRSWDGKESLHWQRHINEKKPGFGLVGNEPEDAGTLVRLKKPALFKMDVKDIFELASKPAVRYIFENATFTKVASEPTGIPGGFLIRCASHYGEADIHFPTGWIVSLTDKSIKDRTRVTKLSEFKKVGDVDRWFPTRVTRSDLGGSAAAEPLATREVTVKSVLMGAAADPAPMILPPGTGIQDNVKGTLESVRGQGPGAGQVEERLKHLIDQAKQKTK